MQHFCYYSANFYVTIKANNTRVLGNTTQRQSLGFCAVLPLLPGKNDIMRKTLTALLMSLVMCITACSNEPNDNPENNSGVITEEAQRPDISYYKCTS